MWATECEERDAQRTVADWIAFLPIVQYDWVAENAERIEMCKKVN